MLPSGMKQVSAGQAAAFYTQFGSNVVENLASEYGEGLELALSREKLGVRRRRSLPKIDRHGSAVRTGLTEDATADERWLSVLMVSGPARVAPATEQTGDTETWSTVAAEESSVFATPGGVRCLFHVIPVFSGGEPQWCRQLPQRWKG
jgi:hypothetical protein